MAKSHISPISIDFSTGIGGIIPSTQQAFKNNAYSGSVRVEEKEKSLSFKKTLQEKLSQEVSTLTQFPSKKELYIFIVQYIISTHEYLNRDVDNLSKTMLDILKGIFYDTDSQVRILLVCKKMEPRVKHNFAYIAVKELKDGRDNDILKMAGLERSVIYYESLVKKSKI